MLDCLDDVGFELGERVLDADQVLAVVVLLLDLLMQAVVDSTLENVRVVGSLHRSTVRVEDGGVLTQKLNVLLGMLTSLVDRLAALASSLCELLALVLDLGVQAVEDGEDGALELLGCLVVLVGNALSLLEPPAVSCVEACRTWVLDLMFSNMPAIPPSD
jgi:phage-related protein